MFTASVKKYFLIFGVCILSSCLPYYMQGFGADKDQGCKHNPYIYEEFPKEWLAWEKVHWDISCFQQRAENTTPYGIAGGYGGGNLPRTRTEHNFGESNPFMRFY